MLTAFLADEDFLGVRIDVNECLEEADRISVEGMDEDELEYTPDHVAAAMSSLGSKFLALAGSVRLRQVQAPAQTVGMTRTRRESFVTDDEDDLLAQQEAETEAKLAEFNLTMAT